MMHIGFNELIVIVVIAIALLKPEKLGRYIRKFKEIAQTVTKESQEMQNAFNEVSAEIQDVTSSTKRINEKDEQEVKR